MKIVIAEEDFSGKAEVSQALNQLKVLLYPPVTVRPNYNIRGTFVKNDMDATSCLVLTGLRTVQRTLKELLDLVTFEIGPYDPAIHDPPTQTYRLNSEDKPN